MLTLHGTPLSHFTRKVRIVLTELGVPFELAGRTETRASYGELMPPNPTDHTVMLSARRGYHVILAVWELADTSGAFYQVADVDFG